MIFHQPHNSLNNSFNAVLYTTEIWKQHFHKSLELVYVINGSLKCYSNGIEYLIKQDDFGLCFPYDIHAYEPQKDTSYWVCVFSEDYVHDFYKMIKDKTGDFKFNCSPSVTRFMTENLINNPEPSRLIIKAALYAVCDEYIKSAKLTDKNKKIDENIAVITEYIEKNHTKDIKLSNIGKLLGYDYHYVSRYFHTVFKMSFSEFLTLYRLETAVGLMEQSDKKFVDIAMESGFQSIRSFNNCFKKHFKMSPTEYKKNHSSNP
jgi:AraC-like DNA-binding protein